MLGRAQRSLPRQRRQALPPPVVGDISLNYERLELAADSGLAIVTYSAASSTSEQALKLLGSWAATPDPGRRDPRPDEA